MRPPILALASAFGILSACAAAPPPATELPPLAAAPALRAETCRGLATFAVVTTDGRRLGIGRSEALDNAGAGPLTGLFQTIVNGVYDAPRPASDREWLDMMRLYASLTADGCLRAVAAADGEASLR